MSKILTTEAFKQRVFNLYGDEYTVIGEYHGAHEKIEILHKCGYSYFAAPTNILNVRSAQKECAIQLMTQKQFSKNIKKLYWLMKLRMC